MPSRLDVGKGTPYPPRCLSIITRCWEPGFGVSSILSHCCYYYYSGSSRFCPWQLHLDQLGKSRFNLILISLLSFEPCITALKYASWAKDLSISLESSRSFWGESVRRFGPTLCHIPGRLGSYKFTPSSRQVQTTRFQSKNQVKQLFRSKLKWKSWSWGRMAP